MKQAFDNKRFHSEDELDASCASFWFKCYVEHLKESWKKASAASPALKVEDFVAALDPHAALCIKFCVKALLQTESFHYLKPFSASMEAHSFGLVKFSWTWQRQTKKTIMHVFRSHRLRRSYAKFSLVFYPRSLRCAMWLRVVEHATSKVNIGSEIIYLYQIYQTVFTLFPFDLRFCFRQWSWCRRRICPRTKRLHGMTLVYLLDKKPISSSLPCTPNLSLSVQRLAFRPAWKTLHKPMRSDLLCQADVSLKCCGRTERNLGVCRWMVQRFGGECQGEISSSNSKALWLFEAMVPLQLRCFT